VTENGEIRPNPRLEKASIAATSRLQRTYSSRERSLTEMMSLSDWYRFIPEALGLLLLIALARMLLPVGITDVSTLPHPYWIPVLLMSAQYGIMGGLFATLASTSAFFINGLPPQTAAQDFYAYAGVVAAQPCAWFGTALVLGGLRTLHMHQQTGQRDRLDKTTLVAEDLADGLERAREEIDRLEQRIATDHSTLASFLHSLANIDLSDRQSLLGSISDAICFGVGATSFVVFLQGAHGLEPCFAVEDGLRLNPTAMPRPQLSLLRQIHDAAADTVCNADTLQIGRLPIWGRIRQAQTGEAMGVVVCSRLLPSQEPASAARRLDEVCRVLAVLLPACAEATFEACDGGN
jgi:hypothetical protein